MHHSVSLKDICHEHILGTIFEELSASSAASFLAIVRLLRPGLPMEGFRERYVRAIRDIPEYKPWIEAMISKGHRVFLVGSDLKVWQTRYRYPIRYWRRYPGGFAEEKPLRLWLAVRTSHRLDEQPRQHDRMREPVYWITMNGDAVTGREKHLAFHSGRISTQSKLIPPPGDARSRSTTCIGWGEWLPASKRNGNNLNIVWADVKSTNRTPLVHMCPLQVWDRASTEASTDVMGGNHGMVCQHHSPGSIVEPSRTCRQKVVPKLPYLDLKTGKFKFADLIDDGDDAESFAIRIKFDCSSARSQHGKVLGPNIGAAHQGIQW